VRVHLVAPKPRATFVDIPDTLLEIWLLQARLDCRSCADLVLGSLSGGWPGVTEWRMAWGDRVEDGLG